jgi:hypothetical protein
MLGVGHPTSRPNAVRTLMLSDAIRALMFGDTVRTLVFRRTGISLVGTDVCFWDIPRPGCVAAS